MRTILILTSLLSAGAGTLSAQGQDTVLVTHIATKARERASELDPALRTANPASATQYTEALADAGRGQFNVAATELTAALQRAPNNALYRGELGFVHLRMGRFEDAVTDYTRAYQNQRRNGWFLVGVALAHAAQRHWTEAAGTIQLAAQTDSAVIDSAVASAATEWFEQASDRTNALAWARLTAARAPGDAQSWLRIGLYLKQRNDTTPEAVQAIQRYVALKGERAEKVAYAILADHVYAANPDSARRLVVMASQDTMYREYAAQIFLQSGRDALQRRDADKALAILDSGRTWATPAQRPAYSNLTGRAQLMKLNVAMADLEENRSCELAHRADTLITMTERNLTEGISFDSSRTALMLQVLPGYRTNAQSAINRCGQAAPGRGRAAPPARRPAPAPAPTRRP